LRRGLSVPLILAVVFGLAVAFFSTVKLLEYAQNNQPTLKVPVPVRDIPMYHEITAKDLELRPILAGGREPNTVLEPNQLVGKVTVAPLYKSEQIRRERVVDRQQFDSSKHIIAVSVSLVRSAGGTVAPGDLVDVWWLQGVNIPGAILATDARVVEMKDAQGKQPGVAVPAVAVLAVKPEEVPQVVWGAEEGSKNVVLVKKFREGGR